MPSISSHFLIGAAIGSGSTALAAERGGADFLLAINAGRLRNMGAPSIACMLPIFDAGPLTETFARQELLALCRIPVLLGVNVWEATCEPSEIAARVKEAGFAGAVNFPSCIYYSRPMQQILSRGRRGIEQEVAVLRAVQDVGLTTMFYCVTRTQARLGADAGLDMICLNLGWNVGGALGHRARTTIDEVAITVREIGRFIKRIHPDVRFMLEGGPIATAEDLARVSALAPIDGYVGGSTIERMPLEVSVADQIVSFRDASRRGGNLDRESEALLAWAGRRGFIGRSKALRVYLRRLRELAATNAPILISAEDGVDLGPTVAALAKPPARHRRSAIVHIDIAGDEFPARARRMLFGRPAGSERPQPLLSDTSIDLIVIHAPDAMPASMQTRLARALRDGSFRSPSSRRPLPVHPRIALVVRTAGADNLANLGIVGEFAEHFEGWVLIAPPLRDRAEDIPSILESMVLKIGHSVPGPSDFTAAAMKTLMSHRWNGNEAELRSLMGRLVGRSSDEPVQPKDLATLLAGNTPPPDHGRNEKDRVVEALWRNGFNRTRTAEDLGVSRKTLYNKIVKYGLQG